jgi:hypothetical protein
MENRPQNQVKHPPEYERDLNPARLEGQNIGPNPGDREVGIRTAYDVKPLHRGLDLGDDELKQIPVLPEGQRLQQGATYLDLRDPERGEFTATGDMSADAECAYVAKDQVPYPTWNKLRGIRDPERT